MRSRGYKRLEFDASGSTTIEAPEGTRFSVYAKRVSGSGTATVAVAGSFVSLPGSNDKVAIQSATAAGSGSTTLIADAKDSVFPYLVVTAALTGSSTTHVYVAGF